MEQKKVKRWFYKCIVSVVAVLIAVTAIVWVVDPYIHFHKPFPFMKYRLYDERYTNDGISRHFDYDAIITGTSMAQNYKVSELNRLFGVNAVKETFSGAGYKELSENLDRALQYNPNIKKIFFSMDYNAIIRDKDWCMYDDYPEYLYDNNSLNDVEYLFNKTVLYHGVLNNIVMTLKGTPSTTMDEYSSWEKETGLEHILNLYDRNNVDTTLPSVLTTEDESMVRENINQNIINLVNRYPEVDFYIVYSPYSICYWDSLKQEGTMERQLQAEQIATELLLDCPNVRLFNYFDQYDVITNTDNYRDKEHYASWINSQILEWMADDVGRVTKENYLEKLAAEKSFYGNYDYDSIYE